MSGVHIDISGLSDAERKVAKIGALALDLRPFWPIVSRLWISFESRQFDSEGEFGGTRWEPLSAAYALWKTANHPGKKILSIKGDLRKAATSPKRVATPQTLTLTISTYSKKGKQMQPGWFQEGTTTMPARPLVFDLPPEALAEVAAAADAYAAEMVARVMGTP